MCVRALKPGGQAIIIAPINFVGSLPKAARAWLDKYAVLENGPKGFDDQHHYNPLPGQFELTNIEVYAFLFRKLEVEAQPEAKLVKKAESH